MVSGGPQALHQLGAALLDAGFDARMVYHPLPTARTSPERYAGYGVPVAADLPDEPDVVVVLAETMTSLVWQFQRATVLIWWLSWDHHPANQRPDRWTKRVKQWWRLRFGRERAYCFQPRPRVRHAWQSEYARQRLVERGVVDPLPLTDYIAPALVQPESALRIDGRTDQVLYNPKKGFAFTQRVIEQARVAAPQVAFVPLLGYSEPQMSELLGRAKAYIDFGDHPGRDRIPREAAACGCVVVTGRKGSAANAVDVPLPEVYKVDQSLDDAPARVVRLLEDVLRDHPTHLRAQQGLREAIRSQRDTFLAEARALGEALSVPAR